MQRREGGGRGRCRGERGEEEVDAEERGRRKR